VLDPDEKYRVAVHEAGHAVVANFTPHAEPLERVSILPRGMALGVTHQTPAADRHILIRPELEARLQVLMGGYAAETIVLGASSSGAENDLKQATDVALKMMAHFGMSERVGPVFHEHRTEHPFLGRTLAGDGGTSDATVHVLEDEARNILVGALDTARQTILEHQAALESLVTTLLAHETVERAGLIEILGPPTRVVPREAACVDSATTS
jgi:cell division protease FtsH